MNIRFFRIKGCLIRSLSIFFMARQVVNLRSLYTFLPLFHILNTVSSFDIPLVHPALEHLCVICTKYIDIHPSCSWQIVSFTYIQIFYSFQSNATEAGGADPTSEKNWIRIRPEFHLYFSKLLKKVSLPNMNSR